MDMKRLTVEEQAEALARERAALEAEMADLAEEKKRLQARGWRDGLYGRIRVSVRTMDWIIGIVGGLIVILVIIGAWL